MTQRWLFGRDSYRPAGEPIDTRRYGVELIDFAPARDFVLRHHYSASVPATRAQVGLFRRGQLVGVAMFSVPMTQAVVPSRTGQPPGRGVELGRFVLLDDVPANGESWFLARAFRELRFACPEVRAVLAYSDPVERRTESGRLVKPGHCGHVYMAHNGRYVGRSSPRTLLLTADGLVVSPRALSKIRNGERGAQGAYEAIVKRGIAPLKPAETLRAWLERVQGELRRLRHPGNHAYVWPLDRRARKVLPPSAGPFPKEVDRAAFVGAEAP